MDLDTEQLMALVAKVRSGQSVDDALVSVPEGQRSQVGQILSVVVVSPEGQLQGLQPVDYTGLPPGSTTLPR